MAGFEPQEPQLFGCMIKTWWGFKHCQWFCDRRSAWQPLRCSDINLAREYLGPICHLWEFVPLLQGLFARPQSLPLLGNPAISLEPWTATMRTSLTTMDSLATVAAASVTSTWPVLLTWPMDQESGSQDTQCFAQQKAVAARVSGGEKT